MNDATKASHPGGFQLDLEFLAALEPELVKPPLLSSLHPRRAAERRWMLTHIAEHLQLGDSRAALVVEVSPLLVAAYSDEFDCVALLEFPAAYRPPLVLERGSRLITVNTYAQRSQGIARDLVPGPGDLGHWGNFAPYIADFLCDQPIQLSQRMREISSAEWARCEAGAAAARWVRDGRPSRCMLPGRPR